MLKIEKGPWSMLFNEEKKPEPKNNSSELLAEGFVSISKNSPVVLEKKETDIEKMDKIIERAPKLRRIQKNWADMESDDELFEEDTNSNYYSDDEW